MTLLVALACLALNGCGGSGAAKPLPAPEVTLTSAEKELWAKLPPDRSAIPVLVYHGIGPEGDFTNAADASYGVDAAGLRHADYGDPPRWLLDDPSSKRSSTS